MNDYRKIVAQLCDFLEAAIEEGKNCGYDKPYDPKDKDQNQFDRGQYTAYVKVYKAFFKYLGEDDGPDDESNDDDGPGCPIEEFLRQIIDLANDSE